MNRTPKRRKPKADRKETAILIRVTREQKMKLKEKAKKAGLDLSGWLRFLGLREILVVAMCLGVGAAHAKGDDANLEFARAHFAAGSKAWDADRYDEALKQFAEAYQLSKKPELLFDIAKCLDRLGRRDEAVAKYQDYLVSGPGLDEKEVANRIGELKELIARNEPPVLALRTPRLAKDELKPPEFPGIENSTPPIYRRWWLWAGAVVVIGAVVAIAVAATTPANFSPPATTLGAMNFHF